MSCHRDCGVAARDDQEDVEKVGYQALVGAISWREAERQTGVRRASLKNHMENHVVAPAEAAAAEEALDEFQELINQARAELEEQFHLAPPDIKPLVLLAMKNLEGLATTKPSGDVLIRTLKTIQEMTGMKNEQRLMLDFARAQRQRQAIRVPNEARALPSGGGE